MGLRHWGWLALLGTLLLTRSSWSRPAPEPDWLGFNGHDWQRMSSDARQAYAAGFLAGAAVTQAATGARDSAEVRARMDTLNRSGKLRFPFSTNVYGSRVSDFYWWKNHLPLPTWYAFLEVNTTLGRPIADSVP
jgi:hypothetical protein